MAIYYIKQTGSDVAAGTSWATAWQTLQKLVISDPLVSGDTVIIRPGSGSPSTPYYPDRSIRWWTSHLTILSEDRAVALGIIPEDVGHVHGKPIIDGTNIASATLEIFRSDIQGFIKPGTHDCHAFTLDGITLKNAKGSAFWAAMDIQYDRAFNAGHTVRNCLIDTAFVHGVFVSRANQFTLELSELTNCGTDPANYNLYHPLYIARSDYPIVQDNVFHDSPGRYGPYLNGSGTSDVQEFVVGPIIRRNRLYNCTGNAIGLYNAVGGEVVNNLIYDTVPMYPASSDGGIRIGIQDGVPNSVPSNGVVVACNTIIENEPHNKGIILVHKPLDGINPIASANCYVFDNTIITAEGTPEQTIEYDPQGQHTVGPNFVAPYTIGNMTTWFVAYGSKDFHPKAGAPLIDTGAESAYNDAGGWKLAPATDFDGDARPQGRHVDPGCFEFDAPTLDYTARITAIDASLTTTLTPTIAANIAPLQTFVIPDWRIDFSTWAGVRLDTIQKASAYNPLVKLEFELRRDGGCGDCTITLMRERVPGPPRGTQFGYKMYTGNIVDIYLHSWYFGDTTQKWYQGIVTKMDDPEGFGETITIKAEGLWNLLSKRYITKYYEGKAINLMVADMLADVYAESHLSNSTAGISLVSPYVISDVEFELTSFADAIEALASVQGSTQYGVDPEGLFYFKTISTATMLTKQVGVNVSTYDKYTESDDLINHYLLQAKQLVGGANLILSKESTGSVALFGRRTRVLPVTGLQNMSDLARYGNALINDTAIYNTHVELDVAGDVYYLFPRGNCKIVKLDRTVMDLPIQSVKYTFSNNATMKLGLGYAPENSLPDEVRRMTRQIAVSKQSSMSNTKIEHTGDDEWAQEVRIDAGKQGNLTLFYDTFKDTKALDSASTSYVHDSHAPMIRSKLVGGSMPYTNLLSPPIDIGVGVNTIRAHLWIDQLGTVEFKRNDALSQYFSRIGTGDWTCENGVLVCSSSLSADQLLWSYDEQEPGPSYTIHLWISPGVADTHWQRILFNRLDDNNYGELAMHNIAGAGSEYLLLKMVAGSPSSLDTGYYAGVAPAKIEITVNDAPTATTVVIKDVYGNTIETLSGAVAGYTPGGPLMTWGLSGWNTPAGHYLTKCGWIEFGSAFTVYAKRNTGTGWVTVVSGTTTDGKVNIDADLSVQAMGSTIQLRCYMRGNPSLRGWGWSAKTT